MESSAWNTIVVNSDLFWYSCFIIFGKPSIVAGNVLFRFECGLVVLGGFIIISSGLFYGYILIFSGKCLPDPCSCCRGDGGCRHCQQSHW